ncbi:MAG: hypothetical protein AB1896_13380 [Thermodesulfobacteriota bacterium]
MVDLKILKPDEQADLGLTLDEFTPHPPSPSGEPAAPDELIELDFEHMDR